ncbi:hypothetical protein AB1287_17565 [Enterobacter asburiae]|uniref:hypothetical protein n=1 Tax=Scandinavium sp. UTDF21-P1B TaxID=3446379 RepID=UPI00348F356E
MAGMTPGEELIELLTLCQQLQSDKDGLKRPAPRRAGVMADEVLDTFAQSILHSCAYAALLDQLLVQQSRLSDVGRQLETQGQLRTEVGDDYALAALEWLERLTGTGNTP